MSETFAAPHYDRVTAAWRLIMGEAFHYGVFEPGEGPADLDRATARLNERMVDAAGEVTSSHTVLDVGCGVGGPARWIAERTGARVHGVSTSAAGIAAANEAAATHSAAARLRFSVADAQDNGLPDASFDVAWVLESSHLMPRRDLMLAECARCLRPDGRLALCDLTFLQPLSLAELLDRRRDLLCLDRVFGRARIEPTSSYREWALAAGFTDVAFRDVSAETAPTLGAWSARLATHRVEVEGLMGDRAADDFARACEVLSELFREGRMGYFVLSARRAAA